MNGLLKKRNTYIHYVKEIHIVTVNTGLTLRPGDRTTPEYLEHFKEAVNASANPVNYLGIDPGKSNGVCGYDAKYYLVFMLTIQAEDMIQFLQQFELVDTCVIEDYRIYSGKEEAHINTDVETLRVIGRVESWAEINKVKLVKQGASIKKNAYAWIGVTPPKKSDPRNHMADANVHFMHWAIKTRRVSARNLL
jgi:hypothetical protein